MAKTKTNKLLNADTAVESYLDNLLQEATEVPEAFVNDIQINHNIHILEAPIVNSEQLENEINSYLDIEPADELSLTDSKIENEIEYPLQCLMFKVKKHLLAIPLIQMGGVVNWDSKLTQLPHTSKYFKGVLKYRDKNVSVVDTAKLFDIKNEALPSHLLVFKNEEWALTCDQLLNVIRVDEGDIKLHSGLASKFIMGTIKSSLAQIIQPNKVTEYLENIKN